MKKKILFLMPSLIGGGAEKVLIDILKNFDYGRYEVTLFLEFKQGVYIEDIPPMVRIISLHKEDNIWFQRIHRRLAERHLYVKLHEIVYRRMFLWLIRKERFDSVISFMEGAAVKFHSYVPDKQQKNISWVHIDFKRKHWSLDFFRNEQDEFETYKKMDQIIFVSDDAKLRFLELYPVDATKCAVLYNLIDSNTIQKEAQKQFISKRTFTICMVGRLNHQKRYDRALEVARKLKEHGYDFEFWILGVGELEGFIKEKIKEYELEKHFLLKGFVKPPYPYVKQADIFLNTSESEGYPLTICEAMCLGKPIVATNVTGAREILDHSKYGLLTEENPESIFLAIQSLIINTEKLNEYAQHALKRAEIFKVQKFMQNMEDIL